jgi:hypothetical protein
VCRCSVVTFFLGRNWPAPAMPAPPMVVRSCCIVLHPWLRLFSSALQRTPYVRRSRRNDSLPPI